MGSNASIHLQKDEIKAIEEDTGIIKSLLSKMIHLLTIFNVLNLIGFNENQIKRLYSRFKNLDRNDSGYLNRESFISIPELHVNPLRDRIIEVLIDDNGENGQLNFRQFAKVLSTFRRRKDNQSKADKLKFLFRVITCDYNF
jgi:Ca2+-binding EF-hand superfamily protein